MKSKFEEKKTQNGMVLQAEIYLLTGNGSMNLRKLLFDSTTPPPPSPPPLSWLKVCRDQVEKARYLSYKHNYESDCTKHRRNGAVVKASASQSVDLGFIPYVELQQKTLKNGIHSCPAWRSA